ncbi:MAG: hypothetical protein JW953_09005 [Anaerolineae bacterium]|nr:hypothetical protein [Anaerolineae bacterium]
MKKTERFGLVLSPAEKEAAAKLAEGESLAAYIRRLIRNAAKQAGVWPPTIGHDQKAGKGHQCKK